MSENETAPSLHEVLARGIDKGLRDVGAYLTGCRDDFCVHPIQCETDGICPPSPGGEVAGRIAWSDIVAMYEKIKDYRPPEPIKLTQGQLDWLKSRGELVPERWSPLQMSAMPGVPLVLVGTVEESTPHLKGWTGWPTDTTEPDGLCGCQGEACVGERSTCRAFGPAEER